MAFESIPSILSSQQILDSAFGRASKIQAADKDRGHRFRKTLIDQLESVRDTIDATLGRYVEKFPSVDQINPYHRALIDLLIGIDAYKIALAAIHRGRLNSIGLLNRTLKTIQRQTDVGVLSVEKRRAWGRISSLVNELERPLSQLADFRATLRRLPSVVPGQATAVIAGYPNVGKSSLIRALTNAEPEVANYPFTTKSANVGHFELHRKGPGVRYHESYVTFQLIDTPGLLDRPAAERNFIEQQATLALQHLADAVIFLRDPTGHCGYPVEVQEHLLAEVRELVPAAPLIVVETKIDVESGSRVDTRAMGLAPADMSVSTVTREGIPELIERLVTIFTSRPKDPELAAFLAGDPALEA